MVSDWSGSRYSLVAKSKICSHSMWSGISAVHSPRGCETLWCRHACILLLRHQRCTLPKGSLLWELGTRALRKLHAHTHTRTDGRTHTDKRCTRTHTLWKVVNRGESAACHCCRVLYV